jgi:hypothetical protein
MFRLGITKGKYKTPFLTITTSKRIIVMEIHTRLSCLFLFKKTIDKNSKGFWRLNFSILTITNFMH